MSENTLTLYDDSAQERWKKIREQLESVATQRRKEKTPKSKIKQRTGGGDKVYSYVDRADYQIWLDKKFPGWSIEGFSAWTEKSQIITPDGSTQENPILFCVSFTLCVLELNGIPRKIPCIGTSPVAQKELQRDNATLLSKKYAAAITEAYKIGCGWLGAFFDLRADEEARDKAAIPVSSEQFHRFKELLVKVPSEYTQSITDAWNTQNKDSADEFLKQLEVKIIKTNASEKKKEPAHA